MNLTLFFRLIVTSIFQTTTATVRFGQKMCYDNTFFFCPTVYAVDGFNISLQINNGNYCSSENGYRELGHTWETVEFGFPSEDDILLHQYSEMYDENDLDFTSVGTVGRIEVSVLEELFAKHGGIDWEKTISIEVFQKFTNTK